MGELTLAVTGARAEHYAATPSLMFALEITETTGEALHAIALRCQIQIEPRQRQYDAQEEERLLDLFGKRERWADTMRGLLWTHAMLMVPPFQCATRVELPVPCTYDFEVAAAKYFHSLGEGEVPLLFLFSGIAFPRRATGFAAEPVPWDREARYRLPVRVWREVMDSAFPNSAWIRLRRDTFDALHCFKSRRALPTWEEALEALLQESSEREPV